MDPRIWQAYGELTPISVAKLNAPVSNYRNNILRASSRGKCKLLPDERWRSVQNADIVCATLSGCARSEVSFAHTINFFL